MEEAEILEGYSDLEKGAYLGAIASIATADRQATPDELDHINELCAAANLSDQQQQAVTRAATELSGEELNRCLDILKTSELKYSLVTDLMAFAKTDQEYSEEEEQSIQKISNYLGLDQKQFSLLDQFSQQAAEVPAGTPQETQNHLLGGGLREKLSGAGINSSSLLKGLISIAAPMLMSGMLSRGLGRGSSMGGGIGGMLGGLGGGGLGSLIGMLNGGGGMRSAGGLLGRMLGGRM
jgi:uncharacterized tellurite resistance protein B-like protein